MRDVILNGYLQVIVKNLYKEIPHFVRDDNFIVFLNNKIVNFSDK
jgi:hypothetical protein